MFCKSIKLNFSVSFLVCFSSTFLQNGLYLAEPQTRCNHVYNPVRRYNSRQWTMLKADYFCISSLNNTSDTCFVMPSLLPSDDNDGRV